jgi:putative ABC transport system permease protein
MQTLFQDLRYAGRLLRRRPVLSATAVLTLMLGIGSTTAVFGLVHSLLLRPLPVVRPGELVRLMENRKDGTVAEAFTLVTHDQLSRGTHAVSDFIASSEQFPRPGEIQVNGEVRQAFSQLVSGNYFDALGVSAARGRVFHEVDSQAAAEPIVVISDDYWRRQFTGDPGAVGSRLRRGNRDFTIVGITPEGFRGTQVDVPVDVWFAIDQVVAADAPDRTRGRWMHIMGRLAPGASISRAEAEASAVLGRSVRFERGDVGYSALRVRLYRPLLLVSWVVALVLLIAAANLANLMRAATVARQREIAMRAAIGASRSRIVRQLLTESVVLSAIGGALGLLVAQWISRILLAFLPPDLAVALPNLRFHIDPSVLAFVLLLSSGTCALFGMLPALRAAGISAQSPRIAFGRSLLVVQIVMCSALLVVSGVFVRTVQNLRGQQAGYQEDRLLVADIGFPRSYQEERRDELIERLRARVARMPGVGVAAFSHVGQLSGSAIEMKIGFLDANPAESELISVIEQRVSPGFMTAMGTPIVAGREFSESDDGHAPLVAIVNESFARRFLPGREPIGARFFRDGGSHSGEPMEIVGVVRDSKWVNLRDESPVMYYRPYKQIGGTPAVRLVVRLTGDRGIVERELLPLAASIDKGLILSNIVPFSEIVDRTLVVERMVAQVSSAFGALALLIASIGLYGTLAYTIARRRREIGVRIAIGAQAGSIEAMFLKESLTLVAIGAAIGIPAGLAVTRLASSLLFGLGPADPISLGVALAALTITTVAATYLPARSAAAIDPIVALRSE